MKFFHRKEQQAPESGRQTGTGAGRIRHKKRLAAAGIVLAGVLAAAILIPKFRAAKASASEDLSLARTVTLQKGSLDSTVSVSGVVRSGTVSTVTTTLAAKVVSVNVAVGDTVKKGDVIAALDTSDLDKQIADKQAQLRDANQQLADEVTRIQGQIDRARSSRTQTQAAQDALVNSATTARDNAKKAADTAKTAYDAAKSQYDTVSAAIANAQNALQTAQSSRQTAYAAWQAAGGLTSVTTTPSSPAGGTPVTTVPQEYLDFQAADAAVTAAQANLDTAKSVYGYDGVAAAFAAAQTASSTAADALSQAQLALESAVTTRQSMLTDSDNSIADLNAQLKAAADKAKKGTSDSELEDLLKKKDGATLKAETDGEVTELDVTVGSVPKDTVAKIQSTTDLILKVTIPEADINRVSVGLPVRITADSLTDTVSGTLTRISPTADGGDASGTAAGAAGYSADITIADPTGLHIGSKAKGDIVLSTKSDVFTVPIDAVGMTADSQSYIRCMQADGSTKDIPVTTGDKNEYYIEVSGDALEEGMSILADANWDALAESSASNMDSEVIF